MVHCRVKLQWITTQILVCLHYLVFYGTAMITQCPFIVSFCSTKKEVKESLEIRKDMRCKEGQNFNFGLNGYVWIPCALAYGSSMKTGCSKRQHSWLLLKWKAEREFSTFEISQLYSAAVKSSSSALLPFLFIMYLNTPIDQVNQLFT